MPGIFRPTLNNGMFDRSFLSRSLFIAARFCFFLGVGLPLVSDCQFLFASQQDSAERTARNESFQRGLMALKDNRLDEALEALTKAEHEHPKDPQVRNFRGIVLARLGQITEARAEYQEAIRGNPQMEDAYRNLGFLEWREHRLAQAREALDHALKLSPSDSFAHHYLGRVQLDGQLYAQAFRELALSEVPWPAEPSFLMQVATGYMVLGKQEDARKALRHLDLRTLTDDESAQAASLFLAAGANKQAIELLRQWSGRLPAGRSWARLDLGLAYLVSGRYEEAIEQARSGLDPLQTERTRTSELALAWSLIGIAHARLGHNDQSVDALRLAARAEPKEEEGWLNLTRELMEANRFADAISAVQEGIASLPKSYALQLRLGAANLAAGHYAAAEDVFRTLMGAGDPLPASYVGLAQVLLRQGRADEAASELAAARQKIGPNFLLSYFLGLSLDRAGKPADGLTAFQEAVLLNPKSPEAHLGMGKTELALGRASDAIAELRETLRLSPDNLQAQRLLARALRRATDVNGEVEEASAPSDVQSRGTDELIGDFLLPKWQVPLDEKNVRQDP
jgi:tetratricopeptide (TPR) repeat protein